MFPSILNTFNRPTPTDRLNSPSHSALHNTVSSALGQVQAVIGTNTGVNASAVGTLMYDVRSPNSDGGGHIQTAVKGGTGQNTFTKGDQLVATGPSTLSKVAIGVDGQSWVVDSSTASGTKWGTPAGTKLGENASVISVFDVPETSIVTATVPAGTLGMSNAIKSVAFVKMLRLQNTSILIRGVYAGNTVASVMINQPVTVNTSVYGQVNFTLLANNSANVQRGILEVDLQDSRNNVSGVTSIRSLYLYDMNTSSVNSAINQTFGITVKASDGGDRFVADGSYVEKIV